MLQSDVGDDNFGRCSRLCRGVHAAFPDRTVAVHSPDCHDDAVAHAHACTRSDHLHLDLLYRTDVPETGHTDPPVAGSAVHLVSCTVARNQSACNSVKHITTRQSTLWTLWRTTETERHTIVSHCHHCHMIGIAPGCGNSLL